MKSDRSFVYRYAVCVVAMVFTVAGRAWVEHMGWGPYRFPFVQLGIIVSAAWGGFGPGMLAVVLGTFASFLFLPPLGKFWVDRPIDLYNVIAFAGVNALIAWAFATAGQRWAAARRSGNSEARPAAGRPRLFLQSRGALASLLGVVAVLAAFGCWGMFSASGTARFDDETTLIPLACLGLAPAVLIFGIGFLPVFSFSVPTTRRHSRV